MNGNGFIGKELPLIISSRTRNQKIVAGDAKSLIEIPTTVASFSQTIASPGELGEGWFCYYTYGVPGAGGCVSLTPAAGTLINGLGLFKVFQGDLVLLRSDGATLHAYLLQKRQYNFTRMLLVQTSQLIQVPVDGEFAVIAAGAGGSGGIAYGVAAGAVAASGGGSGSMAYKRFRLKAGDTLNIVIGAGGVGVTRNSAGTTNGNQGGTTTVTSSGADAVTVTCPGGDGGIGSTVTVAGGVGATQATGGDINLPGGVSGQANIPAAATVQAATGGGALAPDVGITQITGSADAAVASRAVASGGSGVGYVSGNCDGTVGSAASGGGGTSGASADASNTNTAGGIGNTLLRLLKMALNGVGSAATTGAPSTAGGAGAGSGGSRGATSGTGAGGFGAASGGASSTVACTTGVGGAGAGSGGCTVLNAGAVACTSGNGGDGFVLIEWGD